MTDRRQVEFIMGTAVDIDIRGAEHSEAELDQVLQRAFARLREIDHDFSTYNADSIISQIGRGDMLVADAPDDVRFILDLCDTLRATTNGHFDIAAAATSPLSPASQLQGSGMPGAQPIEPSGAVKGWAIEQACDILRNAGVANFCVNIGGDLYASGVPSEHDLWRIGLQHPLDRENLMAVLAIRDLAVATSGFYERGEHIVRPTLAHDPSSIADDGTLLSLTVCGSDITLVDAYATAAFAMGAQGMSWIADQPGFEVFGVDSNHMTHFSSGMHQYLVDSDDSPTPA